MKTYCIPWLRWSCWLLIGLVGTTVSAQADDYDVTDAIYDEVGLKLDLHLQYPTAATATTARSARAGQWYLLDFIKLKPDAVADYSQQRRTWDRDHALCAIEASPGGWSLFRVVEPRGPAGAYDFVAATPIPGEWHTWSQVEYLPTELFTHLPPALERLLAQATGYRELRWVRSCAPGMGCRDLAANR